MIKKMSRYKILPLLAGCIIFLGFWSSGIVHGQEPYEVSVRNVVSEAGSTVNMDVSITPGSGFGAMQLFFNFDPSKLRYIEPENLNQAKGIDLKTFETANGSGSMVINANNAADGEVNIGYINSVPFASGGKILKLSFEVKTGMTGATPVGVTVKELVKDNNGVGILIPTTVKSGSVTIGPPLSVSEFSTDKSSGQSANTSIKLSAAGISGNLPYQYKFYYKLGSTTTTIQDFSTIETATFMPTTAGTYTLYVDIKDDQGKTATKSIENYQVIDTTSPSPGSGGGGGVTPTPNIDVTKALGEIAGAIGGSTVAVPITNNEPVPISILEAARGKDINIVFNYGSYTWTINGKSIQDLPAGVTTYDLSIKTIQNTTLSNLANDPNAIQIEISHNGAFPFTGQLSYQMGASLNGKTVYRYYFNETDKKLEYQDQATVKDGVVRFDFEHASKYVISALLKPEIASVNCTYQTQLENIGWQGFKSNGEVSGTVGESLRLEGIEIKTDDPTKLGVTYQTHVQNIGWQGYKKNGEMSGTTGESLRLEAIQIKLTGTEAENYDVYYQVYTEKFGWLDWAKNGESAGSEGYSYRLEAIKIVIQEKGTQAPGSTDRPFEKNVQCLYQTHVQNIGWQGFRTNGDMSGTEGQALRLEGIEIKFDGQENLGVEYSTHVQNIGWQDFVKDGNMSGTEGKSLRLEAIKIKLTGTDADKYDIYYQVHAQNFGWLDWAKNGEEAGTAGFGYRLEGIRIKVVPKGEAAPGNTEKPFVEN